MLIREEKTVVTAAQNGTKPYNLPIKVSFLEQGPLCHDWPVPDQRILLNVVSSFTYSHSSLLHYPCNRLMASRELLMAREGHGKCFAKVRAATKVSLALSSSRGLPA